MKWFLIPLLLISLNRISAQVSFKLYGNIYNKNKEALSKVKLRVIEGTKTIKVYESDSKGAFNVTFSLNKEYKLDILGDNYLPKRVIVDTKVPSVNKNKSHKLFTLIILDKGKSNKQPHSIVPVSKYYFNKQIGSFTGEKFVIKEEEQQTADKDTQLLQKKLLEEAEQLVREANHIKNQAIRFSDSIKNSAVKIKTIIPEYQPEVLNQLIEKAVDNSTKEIAEDEFNLAGIEKEDFNKDKSVVELQNRIKTLTENKNKTSLDSLALKKDKLALRKKFLDLAHYQLEVDRLKANSKEDSLKIKQRESELYFIQQEMILADQKIENANKEIRLKNLEISRKNLILISLITGLTLLLVFSLVVFYFYRDKKRVNKILEFQNVELEKLSVVARETSNAIIIADNKGKFSWVNKAYSALFGYEVDEVTGKNAKSLIDDKTNSKITKLVEDSLLNGKTASYELETKSKTGRKIWLQSTVTPILNESNEVTKLVVVDSDISQLKRAEKEIRSQNEQITIQNANILSSIYYAKTIQTAILPPLEVLNKSFECFVLYRPKDIVSGDFYWYSFLPGKNGKTEKFIYAVVDCTGHGVPGAFMSMIGNRLLNEIVKEKEVEQPSEILKQLDELIIKALRQKKNDSQDGMDVCICTMEKLQDGSVKTIFAGARRPLYIFKNRSNEVETIKGTRKSIGGSLNTKNKELFTDNELILEKGDVIYLSSDGFADQPAPDRTRFSTPRLVKVLKQEGANPITPQKVKIEAELDKYRGSTEQRDDITIMGVKI